jgi:hypothetical protein
MSTQPTSPQQPHSADASEHIAEAHRRLSTLRQQLDKHPDLEIAIERLEMALSILSNKTGGML